jgi:YD repeat-containing protein
MNNKIIFSLPVFCFLCTGILCAQTTVNSRIVVSPQYLIFYAVQGSTATQSQTFAVSNGGSGTLNFNLSSSTPWFSIDSSSGSITTNNATFTVTVNPSGLTSSSNPNIGDITVSNTDVAQDTKKIRVRLTILLSDAYVHSYEYDSKGNVAARITPNGAVIHYTYDNLNRLINITYPNPNGYTVSYTYDAHGNRTSMTDPHGTTEYYYDWLNRLVYIYYPNASYLLIYNYDRSGKLISITYPDQNQTTINYTYDTDGRLYTVVYPSGTVSYTYDNNSNNLIQKTLPNGVYTTYTYDTAKRITNTVNYQSNGLPISGYQYTYDANSNITKEVETTSTGAITKNYTYDNLNRLTNASYSDGTYETYTYDSMGNRLTMQTSTGTTTYVYDSDNRLIQAGTTYYFYDRNGNLIQKISPSKTETYQYDYNNMLTQYSDGTNTVQYQYDGDRNRISKTVNGVITNYINDINRPVVQVILEMDSNMNWTKRYVYGNELISQESF